MTLRIFTQLVCRPIKFFPHKKSDPCTGGYFHDSVYGDSYSPVAYSPI